MALTKLEFERLDPERDIVIDGEGRIWEVLANRPNDSLEIPGERVVTLLLDGETRWDYGWDDGQIIGAGVGPNAALNHINACVATKCSGK